MNVDQTANAIRAALERDPDIKQDRAPITIRVDDVVHLEGEVEDIVTKRKALRIVRAVAGLSAIIEDRLRVATSERISEDELRDRVLEALLREPAFARMDIRAGRDAPATSEQDWMRIEVRACNVRLTGEVNSLSHRRLAEVIIWWVAGTCDVDNRLHVRPPEEERDEELTDAVRLVLEKEPALDATQVSVITRDREITLRGAVFSEDQKRTATQDCWYIPGVHAVHNELQIVSR